MAGTRSEATPAGYTSIGEKTKYSTYNLTRYPDAYDSRDNNGNMRGFTNMQDYNMAEHVNSLADSIMVIQRMLGLNPEGTHANIQTRFNVLDQHNHDTRYGGSGWITSQTLTGHTHTGTAGHPSKINLATEIQGTLSKSFLDLTTATGLTGSDIAMSKDSSKTIATSLNEALSTVDGGTIEKDLSVRGKLSSRIMREWHSSDSSGTSTPANDTRANTAKRLSGTTSTRFIDKRAVDLEYGKYVIGVRLRISSKPSQEVAHIRLYNRIGGKDVLNAEKKLLGTDFTVTGQWQTFYLVCEVTGDSDSSTPRIIIGKSSTTSSVDIDFDYAYMMPVTPAVFDM